MKKGSKKGLKKGLNILGKGLVFLLFSMAILWGLISIVYVIVKGVTTLNLDDADGSTLWITAGVLGTLLLVSAFKLVKAFKDLRETSDDDNFELINNVISVGASLAATATATLTLSVNFLGFELTLFSIIWSVILSMTILMVCNVLIESKEYSRVDIILIIVLFIVDISSFVIMSYQIF